MSRFETVKTAQELLDWLVALQGEVSLSSLSVQLEGCDCIGPLGVASLKGGSLWLWREKEKGDLGYGTEPWKE